MKYPIEIKGKTIKQVTKLNLSGLGLKEFPENLFEYTNLTKLVLSNNKIKVIPQDILKLKKLKVLDLANNEISVLHGSVFKLPKLRTLNVYGNKIKNFPKQIYDSKIQVLIAGKNQIEEIELQKLKELVKVDLTYNKINELTIIEDVPMLKVLRIKDNPLGALGVSGGFSKQLDYCDVILPDMTGKSKELWEKKVVKKSIEIKDEKIKIMEEKHSIFISYSHADERWLKQLQTHLIPLKKYYGIEEWEDKRLRTSDKWEEEITRALNNATIAILLVSAAFMASDFINNKELQPLLHNAESKGTKIMPLIVSPCGTFVESGLSVFQAANDPNKTLIEMTEGEVQRTLVKLVDDIKYFIGEKKK